MQKFESLEFSDSDIIITFDRVSGADYSVLDGDFFGGGGCVGWFFGRVFRYSVFSARHSEHSSILDVFFLEHSLLPWMSRFPGRSLAVQQLLGKRWGPCFQ